MLMDFTTIEAQTLLGFGGLLLALGGLYWLISNGDRDRREVSAEARILRSSWIVCRSPDHRRVADFVAAAFDIPLATVIAHNTVQVLETDRPALLHTPPGVTLQRWH